MSARQASAAVEAGRFRVLAAVAAAVLLLLSAAIYNGYPLTFWDTHAYLEHARSLLPRPDRLIGYSIFIRLTSLGVTLWTVVGAQCAIVAWLLWRVARVLLGRASVSGYLGLCGALVVTTALPWVTGQLLADVFSAVLVLALFLLLEARELGRVERAALLGTVALCVTVHLTHLPLGMGLLVLAFIAYARSAAPQRALARIRAPALALLAGLAGISGFNFARTGSAALASGSDAFVLAHLVETGIASRLLSAHCPERAYMLCRYRAQLPMSTDRFLWVDALDIYPWQRRDLIAPEAHRMLRDSLVEYPGVHLQVAVSQTLKALSRFATGEGLDGEASYMIDPEVASTVPRELTAYRAAKQQASALPLAALRAVHTPCGWLALFSACALVVAASLPRLARLRDEPSVRFAAFALAAYLLNAVLCANLSGVFDRYESRVLWLLALGPWAFWLKRAGPGNVSLVHA